MFTTLKAVQDDGSRCERLSPIQPGWLVAYRGRDGRLHGGRFDREHGTVERGEYKAGGWIFHLTDGTSVLAPAIVGVTKTDIDGTILWTWMVRKHGLDGKKARQEQDEWRLPTLSNL